jgi:hypothetical protein
MVTIIDAGRVVEADARIDDGGFRLRPEAMKSARARGDRAGG